MAITGQEQQKYGFSSRKGSGLLGEVTLVTLYKAALTAGKAYTNHKHHHVHHFHHEDKAGEDDYDINPIMTMTPAPPMLPAMGTQFPFLSNGQLLPMLPISELTAFRGPGGSKNINLFTPFSSQVDITLPGMQRLFKRDQAKEMMVTGKRMKKSENDEDTETGVGDILKTTPKVTKKAKRETTQTDQTKRVVFKEDGILNTDEEKSLGVKKRQTLEGMEMSVEKNQKKRTLFNDQFQFGLIPGDDLSSLFPGDGFVLGGGGPKFGGEERNKLPEPAVQMEPAEWEVRSIMAVCSGCSEDPFRKASIISWRESPKKVYAGAHYVPASPECQRF